MLDALAKPAPWRGALDAALNFFYPPVCQLCRKQRAGADAGYVCGDCWQGIRFVAPPFCDRCGLPHDGDITHPYRCSNCQDMEFAFASARSAVHANGLILDVIHRYKYGRALWFEPFLADLLIRQAAPALRTERWDLIVPVPLYPTREREREFNQASRLAVWLGRATGIPVHEGLVRRIKPTPSQTALSRSERAANVAGAFAWCGAERLNGRNVVALDDVFTTGATTSACARALRAGGAGKVGVWTLARGT